MAVFFDCIHRPHLDINVLNFALTLEHLEKNFYDTGLNQYSAQDFINAGFPGWLYGRMERSVFMRRSTSRDYNPYLAIKQLNLANTNCTSFQIQQDVMSDGSG